ncbi:MAG: CRTAC1 family protein [Gammaproteobacteria bacterium]|nr:CRTAC1 family protein [Gammaproteobacteria bacterium]
MTPAKRSGVLLRCYFCATLIAAAHPHQALAQIGAAADSTAFIEAGQDFPAEDKNLRKWDAPTVADLDQDGYLDLLLNDHGFSVKIYWNNRGRYAKPYDLIMGDAHGISVGDFDKDGNQEIVISRGGGSGTNARNSVIFRVDRARTISRLPEFDVPLAFMRGRTVKFFDGNNDGNLDLINFAFPATGMQGQTENYIYKNDGQGSLVLTSTIPAVNRDGQKTLLTDFNGDNIVDLVLYGDGNIKAYQGLGDFKFKDISDTVLPHDISDVTGIVELDYDNDGDFDLYLTRGQEFVSGETFYDKATSTWGFYTKRGEFQFDDLPAEDVIHIENYQAPWPDKKIFIGESAYEYKFPGETHSGKDLTLVNSDALGWPDTRTEKGIYIGYVGNNRWRIAGHVWSPVTGVVRGVNDYPDFAHSKGLADVLLENNSGKFRDVTKAAQLDIEEHTTGAAAADFDNNGTQDLVVMRRGNLVTPNRSRVYLNQGDGKFKELPMHGVVSTELGAIGMGVETLDYNRDGKVDILLGNERGKWHLFKNTIPAGKHAQQLVIEVGSSETAAAPALGAVVAVQGCGKNQVKRVGTTGAAYSLSYNSFLHFGLGDCVAPVKVKVTWSNGETVKRELKAGKAFETIGVK